MTNDEIKKALNRFRKAAEKELSFSLCGCCYMNKKQLESRTATIALCCDVPYEKDLEWARASMDAVQQYENWTDAEKAESKARSLQEIAGVEELRRKYGTRQNEAVEKMNEIVRSKSFERFGQESGGTVTWKLEMKKPGAGLCGRYQIRLSY